MRQGEREELGGGEAPHSFAAKFTREVLRGRHRGGVGGVGNAPFTTTTAHFPRVVALSLHICESQFSYSRSAVLHKPRVARAESCALVPNWSPGFCRVDGATSDWSPPRQYSPSELAAPPDLYKRNGLTDLIFPNASYIVEGPLPL